jgi:hypothetical protein
MESLPDILLQFIFACFGTDCRTHCRLMLTCKRFLAQYDSSGDGVHQGVVTIVYSRMQSGASTRDGPLLSLRYLYGIVATETLPTGGVTYVGRSRSIVWCTTDRVYFRDASGVVVAKPRPWRAEFEQAPVSSLDGRRVATFSGGRVTVWDTVTRSVFRSLDLTYYTVVIQAVCFDGSGDALFVSSLTEILLFDVQSGRLQESLDSWDYENHMADVPAYYDSLRECLVKLAYDPETGSAVVGGTLTSVYWDPASPASYCPRPYCEDYVRIIACKPNYVALYSIALKMVMVNNLKNGKDMILDTSSLPSDYWFYDLDVSSNRQYVVTAGIDGVYMWRSDGMIVQKVADHQVALTVEFSYDNKHILSCGRDGVVRETPVGR